ncbi:MAG TPA: hypothetical protein VEX18_18070, partial [Polyangiaceae bacterium]|nr:hypothetical protein [Polyangiaceae bacterium]
MGARESRARLLAPPFLVVGMLAACGSVEAGDGSDNPGGQTEGGTGGAPIAGTGGAFAGNGGVPPNFNPPPLMRSCPFGPPIEGERCTQSGFGSMGFTSPPICSYPSGCEALCKESFWTLRGNCGGA